jgi:hypothetical protein
MPCLTNTALAEWKARDKYLVECTLDSGSALLGAALHLPQGVITVTDVPGVK